MKTTKESRKEDKEYCLRNMKGDGYFNNESGYELLLDIEELENALRQKTSVTEVLLYESLEADFKDRIEELEKQLIHGMDVSDELIKIQRKLQKQNELMKAALKECNKIAWQEEPLKVNVKVANEIYSALKKIEDDQ